MPLLVDHPHPGVARLLLDRPERHNALDRALVEALHAAVEAQREHVIVLGSSGAGTVLRRRRHGASTTPSARG